MSIFIVPIVGVLSIAGFLACDLNFDTQLKAIVISYIINVYNEKVKRANTSPCNLYRQGVVVN